jgi:hypothetical protein
LNGWTSQNVFRAHAGIGPAGCVEPDAFERVQDLEPQLSILDGQSPNGSLDLMAMEARQRLLDDVTLSTGHARDPGNVYRRFDGLHVPIDNSRSDFFRWCIWFGAQQLVQLAACYQSHVKRTEICHWSPILI